ncbi:MAG: Mrp/NBP35 family ATP-binding protein [Alphaproteobacteria bacterium]
MSLITKEQITNLLKSVTISNGKTNIIEAGLVSGIIIRDQAIGFVIEALPEIENEIEQIKEKCYEALNNLNLKNITIVPTKENVTPNANIKKKYKILNVKKVVLVASGKGGVGKSTIAANLALAATMQNKKIGLIDADINGPSIPHIFNVTEKPIIKDGKLIPIEKYNVKLLSMGLLIDQNLATIWRSPMYNKAMNQIIAGANWGELDLIIIDMPPGTGDIHLSLAENYEIDGVIIVSTPQNLALLDVKKALNMYDKFNLPIIGLIENMSYLVDNDGSKNYIFGQDGVKMLATKKNLNFLGEIPFEEKIRKIGDKAVASEDIDYIYNVYGKFLRYII